MVPATPTIAGVAGAALLGAAALVASGSSADAGRPRRRPPTFRQLTFRRGWVDQARFAPDGRTVIYGAGWDGKPVELFQTRTDSPESRPLGLVHAKVLSIRPRARWPSCSTRRADRATSSWARSRWCPHGGTPRELLEEVIAADWTPDGRDLCVSRLRPNAEVTIELPPGTILRAQRAIFRADMLRSVPRRSPRRLPRLPRREGDDRRSREQDEQGRLGRRNHVLGPGLGADGPGGVVHGRREHGRPRRLRGGPRRSAAARLPLGRRPRPRRHRARRPRACSTGPSTDGQRWRSCRAIAPSRT